MDCGVEGGVGVDYHLLHRLGGVDVWHCDGCGLKTSCKELWVQRMIMKNARRFIHVALMYHGLLG